MSEDNQQPIGEHELEERLRAALTSRADRVQIDGSALTAIRDRTSRKAINRFWRPIAVGLAAAAVIVGAAFIPRLINRAAPPAAASSVATADKTAPSTARSTAPSTAKSTVPSGVALPISAKTRAVYPVSDSSIAAAAITNNETQKFWLSDDPVATALAFCKLVVPVLTASSDVALSTGDVVASKESVPNSEGVVVPIYTSANGALLTNVYLRYVQQGATRVWLVIGASVPGGEANAPLTVDAPIRSVSKIAVTGKLRGSLKTANTQLLALAVGLNPQNSPQTSAVNSEVPTAQPTINSTSYALSFGALSGSPAIVVATIDGPTITGLVATPTN